MRAEYLVKTSAMYLPILNYLLTNPQSPLPTTPSPHDNFSEGLITRIISFWNWSRFSWEWWGQGKIRKLTAEMEFSQPHKNHNRDKKWKNNKFLCQLFSRSDITKQPKAQLCVQNRTWPWAHSPQAPREAQFLWLQIHWGTLLPYPPSLDFCFLTIPLPCSSLQVIRKGKVGK